MPRAKHTDELAAEPRPWQRIDCSRHQLVGILVLELSEVELAAPGDAQGFGEQLGRIQLGQFLAAAQVALAIGEQMGTGLGHRQVVADGAHAVLQGSAATGVHVHIATGHGGDTQLPGQIQAMLQQRRIVGAAVQLHAQPQALGKALTQPGTGQGVVIRRGQPDGQQPIRRHGQILVEQDVAAFFRAPSGPGDQRAQTLVTGEVLDQHNQPGAVLQPQLAADDQLHLMLLGGLPGPHDAGQGAFVGDRQGTIAEQLGALEQLGSAGGPALETEVRQAVQFGVARQAHANQPCSRSGPSSPTLRKAQPRWPLRVSIR